MKFYKIISVFYKIISVIAYCIVAFFIVNSILLIIIFIRFPPLLVIFCIWLLMTAIKLIKKSFVSFSKGNTEQGIHLLLVGILLPVGIVLAGYFFLKVLAQQ